MRFRLCVAALVAVLSVPSGFAKIYPDDFLIPVAPSAEDDRSSSQPLFLASEIPVGRLTRAQFIDAIASRLYDSDAHGRCFEDLVLSPTVNYRLLFNDVSLDSPYASSVCVAMRSGLVRGYGDGTFRPDQMISAAEAATIFSRIQSSPRGVRAKEAWYGPSMEAMRAVDREFTMRPWENFTGAQLKHSLCVLKNATPKLDPLEEFESGC